MRIDPKDLRRHYESLSDEGFLDIDRSDLAPVAQRIYDQEIARRGLDHPQGPEMEAFHRPLPISTVGADGDIASELRDSDAGPPPAWLEDAACAWSAYIYPNGDYMVIGAEVQAALLEAGIPNRIVVKPSDPKPPSTTSAASIQRCLNDWFPSLASRYFHFIHPWPYASFVTQTLINRPDGRLVFAVVAQEYIEALFW